MNIKHDEFAGMSQLSGKNLWEDCQFVNNLPQCRMMDLKLFGNAFPRLIGSNNFFSKILAEDFPPQYQKSRLPKPPKKVLAFAGLQLTKTPNKCFTNSHYRSIYPRKMKYTTISCQWSCCESILCVHVLVKQHDGFMRFNLDVDWLFGEIVRKKAHFSVSK